MTPTPDWKLECFEWLAVERWTPEYLLQQEQVNGKHYCKVCDKFVSPAEAEAHCKAHVKERAAYLKRRKAERPKELVAKVCSECHTAFEMERRKGRYPSRCPDCRKEDVHEQEES